VGVSVEMVVSSGLTVAAVKEDIVGDMNGVLVGDMNFVVVGLVGDMRAGHCIASELISIRCYLVPYPSHQHLPFNSPICVCTPSHSIFIAAPMLVHFNPS
jgi:hypothetical protein